MISTRLRELLLTPVRWGWKQCWCREKWRESFCLLRQSQSKSSGAPLQRNWERGTTFGLGVWKLPSLLVWAPTVWSCKRPWSTQSHYSSKSIHSARIECWVLRLQPHNHQVCYVPSRKNIADALSRWTKIPASDQSVRDDGYVRIVAAYRSSACCPCCTENQRDLTDLSARSRVASCQKLPHWRKVGQRFEAILACTQWIDLHRSCDSGRNKNICTPSSSQESCESNSWEAPRSCKDKGKA